MAGEAATAGYRIRRAARRRATTLDLSFLRLEEVPEAVGSLTQLTELNLHANRLRALPQWLSNLTHLNTLQLSVNRLTELPEVVGSLPSLTGLYVSVNELTRLPEWLGTLSNLTTLRLGLNRLTALPESVGDLTSLTTLDLGSNRLIALPKSVGNLTNLTGLNLGDNRLAELPKSLGNLTRLRTLYLANNPLGSPPPQIVEGGASAVLAFLRDSAVRIKVRMWASRVLVVGETAVGKTSLVKRLTGGAYDPDEGQTRGVRVDPLLLDHPTEPKTTMSLTLWDLGGRPEYRAAQRFHLTDRSLFVLVWNARACRRDGKIPAWLDAITARAPDSPILVVATHGDEPPVTTLPQDLPTRYPRIVGVHTVDAESGRGIDEVREAIRRHSAALPLMGVSWPTSWADAARAVWGLDGHAATAEQVWAAMAREAVTSFESRLTIARALHDLGDMMLFADVPGLDQRAILRPQWLDQRITAVLDSDAVAAAHGVLTRAQRDRLWADLDDPDLLDLLLRTMERFDLAYRTGDAQHSEDVALVVELLGDARPPRADLLWRQALGKPRVRQIEIVYKLKSRQAGIPTGFIARQHRYTTGLHWSRGALLHDRDPHHPAYALLVDDEREQPTITLRVCGRHPAHFLSVLAEGFEGIARQHHPGLIERRLVPCACQDPAPVRCEHVFDLDDLIAEAANADPGADRKVLCPRTRRRIDARVMLDGLHDSGASTQIDQPQHAPEDRPGTLERIDARRLAALNGIRALLADRARAGVLCPGLFSVQVPGHPRPLRRRRRHRHRYRRTPTLQLCLWCEWPYGPDGPHALAEGQGVYQLSRLPLRLRDYLPILRTLVATLGPNAPIIAPDIGTPGPGPGQGPTRPAGVATAFRGLRIALCQLDPQQTWGGLSPVASPENGRILYLCREHIHALEYPYRSAQGTSAAR